jgi:hypothetical protein
MSDAVAELFATDKPAGSWVAIDVVCVAFGVRQRQAYNLAKDEGWRTAPGHYPKQYAFADVRATYLNRKATP